MSRGSFQLALNAFPEHCSSSPFTLKTTFLVFYSPSWRWTGLCVQFVCPNLDAGSWATWPPKACIRLGQKASSCLWLGEYSTGDVRNVSFSIDRIAGATSKCLNTWMLSVTSVLAALTSYLLQVSSCWYLDGRPAVSALCFPSSWVSFSFMKCSSVSTERDIPTERARIWEYPFLSLGKYLPWQSRKQNWDLSHPGIKYSSHSQQCS